MGRNDNPIVAAMEALGGRPEHLAVIARCSYPQVYYWLKQRRVTDPQHLVRIARALEALGITRPTLEELAGIADEQRARMRG